jgi:hypothetical protein
MRRMCGTWATTSTVLVATDEDERARTEEDELLLLLLLLLVRFARRLLAVTLKSVALMANRDVRSVQILLLLSRSRICTSGTHRLLPAGSEDSTAPAVDKSGKKRMTGDRTGIAV